MTDNPSKNYLDAALHLADMALRLSNKLAKLRSDAEATPTA